MPEEKKDEAVGTGKQTKTERHISDYVGSGIHLFLSTLAVLLIVAAVIATFDTVVRDFPGLWQPRDEYGVLLNIIDNLLLVAIAAEFALLLLFRRMSAVVEVVIFVLARKTVNPQISSFDLLLCSAAIAGLIVLRFYYLPRKED